jgi:hypothetical protein
MSVASSWHFFPHFEASLFRLYLCHATHSEDLKGSRVRELFLIISSLDNTESFSKILRCIVMDVSLLGQKETCLKLLLLLLS